MEMKIILILAFINLSLGHFSFDEYIKKFKKSYNLKEYAERESIYNKNLMEISKHNAKYAKKQVSYKKGINQFTDISQEEFELFVLQEISPIQEDKKTNSHRCICLSPISEIQIFIYMTTHI